MLLSRTDKINYYLDIAQTVSERGTCLKFCSGAVIVKNDQIISTGYRGAPRGRKNCCDISYCTCDSLMSSSPNYNPCRAVDAEANAIISARRQDMIGSTLYLSLMDSVATKTIDNISVTGDCQRLIINAGIKKVIIRSVEKKFNVINVEDDWVLGDDTLDPKAFTANAYPYTDIRSK